MQRCNGVTEFKQAENKPSNYVIVKCILNRCDESCMGTGIRLLFGRHIVRFAIGDERHHYFVQEFDATNFNERNKNQME